jgi:hypothetical protein
MPDDQDLRAITQQPGSGPAFDARPRSERPGRPAIRTTFQFRGRLSPADGEELEAARLRASRYLLKWLQERWPRAFPSGAWEGRSFDTDEHGQTITCVSIRERGIWAARLTHPDAPFRGRPAVPGRAWTTDLALAVEEAAIAVAVRVICSSLFYADQPIVYTRPRAVLDLGQQFHFPDQRPMTGRPWYVLPSELGELRRYLELTTRSGPIVMLTEPSSGKLGLRVRRFLLDEVDLARRLQSLATVACLDSRSSFAWTNLVGKSWSAYLGAVRTYLPGLRFDADSPLVHPLLRPERVLAFDYEGKTAEQAFTDFLVDQVFARSALRPIDWRPCRFVPDARVLEAELARRRAKDNVDVVELYEAENLALKQQLAEANEEAQAYNDDALHERRYREEFEQDNRKLRARIDLLQRAVEDKSGVHPDEEVEIPAEYDDLPAWVDRYLAGRLLLLPRAVRACKAAAYGDVPLVFHSLLLLAHEYRDMKMGMDRSREAFDKKRFSLAVEVGRSVSATAAGREGDEYWVAYPVGGERKQLLDQHLRKGTSRDPRQTLAVYFFWDGDTSQVVVGWLPSHLDNSLT